MERLDPIEQVEREPRPLAPELVTKILGAIPASHLRDRTLFTLLYETGIRVGEALGLLASEVDLSTDDEKIRVFGKGQRERTVMLTAAPESIRLLRRYLKQSRITSGSVFRGDPRYGGSPLPLEFSVVHYAWQKYCRKAGVEATIHQLRHSRASQLLQAGVPVTTVRKQLGHRNIKKSVPVLLLYGKLVLTPLEKLELPSEVEAARADLVSVLPPTGLPEVLLEVHRWTNFAHDLTHLTGRRRPSAEREAAILPALLAVLVAEATNLGLATMSNSSGIALHELEAAYDWYFREETLRTAIHHVITYHGTLPLATRFGDGKTSSSDGIRFGMADSDLQARHLELLWYASRGDPLQPCEQSGRTILDRCGQLHDAGSHLRPGWVALSGCAGDQRALYRYRWLY